MTTRNEHPSRDAMHAVVARRIEAVAGCRLNEIEAHAAATGLPLNLWMVGRGPSLHSAWMQWRFDPSRNATWPDLLRSLDDHVGEQRVRLARAVTEGVGAGNHFAARGEIAHMHVDRYVHALRTASHGATREAMSKVIDAYRNAVDQLSCQMPNHTGVIETTQGRLTDHNGVCALCLPTLIGGGLFDGERLRIPMDVPETMALHLVDRKVGEIMATGGVLSGISGRRVIEASSQPGWVTLRTAGEWVRIVDVTRID